MSFNCDSSRLAVLDVNGVLSLYELSLSDPCHLQKFGPDHKDVWDLLWADDDPELIVIMEKTKMYVIRGTESEEPLQSSGHLCAFKDLQVKALLVDEIMLDPENPCQSYIINFESKEFRDTRDVLGKLSLEEACQFVETKRHPQLWKPVCESALSQLDLSVAEKAFVKCSDYAGLQFVKKLRKMDSEVKQKAEVAAFLNRFEDAERIYLELDRRDLAVDLRMKLGDWFRVVQLLKTGGGAGDDTQLSSAWNAIGDYYYERQKYQNALTYYSQGQNSSRLLDCLYILEDFERMLKLSEGLPECHPLLENIAEKFASFGMCPEASSAFIRAGRVDRAVEVCISLNHWDEALHLAEKSNLANVPSLLTEYASSLLSKNRLFSAIAVYRKAGKYLEAAKLIFKMPSVMPKDLTSPMRMKKIFVSGALLIEQYTQSLVERHGKSNEGGTSVANQLHQMVLVDSLTASDTALIDSAWRGAEAYHFYMLAQQQWYSGQVESCLRTVC
jgi:WD repeat-containing protein 35